MHRLVWFFVAAVLSVAGDWTHWRGPQQNGFAKAESLPETWSAEGENLLWKAPYGTRSAPVVHNGRVFMINAAGEGERLQERVVALDLESGKLIWEHRFNVFLTDIVAHRLGWANPCVDPETGYVFAHGVQGLFFCFDRDGKIIWHRSLTEEFGRVSGYGGRTHSPIVYGDLVIVSFLNSSWGPQGKGLHRYLAMNKNTGEVVWWTAADGTPLDTTYSTPVIATIQGVDLLIAGAADGTVQAFKAATGEPVWKFVLSKRGLNTSVVVMGHNVYAAHSEENIDTSVMGRLVCIDATGKGDVTATHERWRIDGLGDGYASLALGDGMLFACDNAANLYAIDPDSGQQFWQFNYGNAAKGSPVYGDGKIYVGEEAGKWHVLQVDKKGCRELDNDAFHLENGAPIEIHASPAIVDGRVLLPNRTELFCIGKGKKQESETMPSLVSKGEVGPPTHLQVVPAETVLSVGEKQTFHARQFDANGHLIGEVDATWSVKGLPGSVEAGAYTATGGMSAGMVIAKVGEMSAEARVRVVPALPYHQDFESLPVDGNPSGWITSKMKTAVTDVNGNKVLRKLADKPDPKFARLRSYIMPPIPGNYTVQADMSGAKKKRFYPDMGLIHSGYMLILMGTTRSPVVRLVTWDPIPRLQVDVPFDWKPDMWYTAKLSIDHHADGTATVHGKVWPQGEAEPEAWTVEMTDPIARADGSPGLYAYSVGISENSPGTEVFFDNVKVFQNP